MSHKKALLTVFKHRFSLADDRADLGRGFQGLADFEPAHECHLEIFGSLALAKQKYENLKSEDNFNCWV